MLKSQGLRSFIAALVVMTVVVADARAADIFFLMNNFEAQTEGDEAQIEFLEELGHDLDFWAGNGELDVRNDPDGALEAAEAADILWIDESVSSGRVGMFADIETPIINNENFACDVLGMGGGAREDEGHGSPGTVRDGTDGNPEIIHGTHFGTEIEIVADSHPLIQLSGLTNGIHAVYDDPGGRMSWCSPQEGTGTILAVMPEFKASHPEASVISIYEAGEENADGVEMPGMRINTFLSDTNLGPPPEGEPWGGSNGSGEAWEATLLTDAGKALLRGAIDYALGINPDPYAILDTGLTDLDERKTYVHDTLGTWIGDSNKDGEFNSSDLVFVLNAGEYEDGIAGNSTWVEGDWNGDKDFDSGDLVYGLGDGGYEAGARASTAAVPEPSSVVLLLMGALALVRRRR